MKFPSFWKFTTSERSGLDRKWQMCPSLLRKEDFEKSFNRQIELCKKKRLSMSLNTLFFHSLCSDILDGFSFWTNNTLPKWENRIRAEIICMSYSLQILFRAHKWSTALSDALNAYKHAHTFEHKIVTHTPSPISEGQEAICPLKQRHNGRIRGLY